MQDEQMSHSTNTHLFLGCSRLWRYMKLTRRRLMSFDLQKNSRYKIMEIID